MELLKQIRDQLDACELHLARQENELALCDVIIALRTITDLIALQVVPDERQ